MLGALTMLPPLSIDSSLPALPLIARSLGAPASLLQLTLSAFVLSFGFAQLVLGPLSDRYGRRPVLLLGMGVYVLAGVGCTIVSDARVLIALRLLQGAGACAGTVCARAIAQDLSRDRASATFRQAILSAVNGLAPVIAPLLGAVILATLGWRQIYGVLALIGLALFAMIALGIPETSPRVGGAFVEAYRRVLRLPRTTGLALTVGIGFFGFFALITGSPFVLIAQMHLTTTQFALTFALNATVFTIAAAISGRLARRIDPELLLGTGVALLLASSIAACIVDGFFPSVAGFITTWTLVAFGIAFTLPGSFGAMLHAARKDAGLGAGIIGAAQMIAGAAGSALIGAIPGPPTSALAVLVLAGGIGSAAGYALSKPRLGEERHGVEARAENR